MDHLLDRGHFEVVGDFVSPDGRKKYILGFTGKYFLDELVMYTSRANVDHDETLVELFLNTLNRGRRFISKPNKRNFETLTHLIMYAHQAGVSMTSAKSA